MRSMLLLLPLPSPWLANTLSAPRFTRSLRRDSTIVFTSDGFRSTFVPATADSSKNTMLCKPVTPGLSTRTMLIRCASCT